MDKNLLNLKQTFLELANKELAFKMSAYMLNQFDFLGIQTPMRRKLSNEFIKITSDYNASQLLNLVNSLWEIPYREFQYIAIDLMMKNNTKFTLNDIPQLFDIAIQKAWWDSIDGLAAVVSKILKCHRSSTDEFQQILEHAITSENLWIRRIALLHQLGWKELTDVKRLFAFALQNANNKNFFIRKAIGWSLRDYAKYDPIRVYEFVKIHKNQFSSLTLREATKHQKKHDLLQGPTTS
ncbi:MULTISPECIES: DNA alkylation repair protein [Legionella]|uniref:DNA alkylation repair enzyme n=1 Tax=Legionella maceachernii TaxID=466 RepID=A0A0W0VZ97_9GAMM|nr:DNA alkylation repair protein [Legionella maceachernii]KTD25620.1 DNA alkylation repair enzyme [Legionella maceachernii]SJZ57755.1 3-methyladenine DNA glycosylase AlkD [Legionella maceachernii]SUP00650.1 DNA alkylation repair enzyme [Legionella maceachernii]